MAASIRAQLGGEHAFWKAPDYHKKTKKELAASYPPNTPIYTYRSDHPVIRIAKDFFIALSFTVLFYSAAHYLAKKTVTLPTYTFPHAYRGWQFVKWTMPIALFKLVHAIAGIAVIPVWIFKFFPNWVRLLSKEILPVAFCNALRKCSLP